MNLNALTALLVLITGGVLWGIPGMVLFLPYAAIFKVAAEHYKELRPVSQIMRDDLHQDSSSPDDIIAKIRNWFRKRK